MYIMKQLGLLLLALIVMVACFQRDTMAGSDKKGKAGRIDRSTDSSRVASVAGNILRSVKPGGQLSKAIDHIDTVAESASPADSASLDLTIKQKDMVSWVYLDTTCTIVKLLFNDSLEAGRYRFFLNPKAVSSYFYSTDVAYAYPTSCWQVLRIGEKRSIEKRLMKR
jgi:hypothetical protein